LSGIVREKQFLDLCEGLTVVPSLVAPNGT
jgi:hypothetical protein